MTVTALNSISPPSQQAESVLVESPNSSSARDSSIYKHLLIPNVVFNTQSLLFEVVI